MRTALEILNELGVRPRGRATGNFKTLCPKCSHTRKNKKDPCLSVRIDNSGVGLRCHNCNYTDGRFYDDTQHKTHSMAGSSFAQRGGSDKYGALLRDARRNWR
jgi:hypothetical protein